MLTELRIDALAVIDSLTIEFGNHFNVLTGETGAGKSILVEALQLLLGGRGQNQVIRRNANAATCMATFDIRHHPKSSAWLQQHGFDEQPLCTVQRTLNSNGRSMASINHQRATLLQLKSFVGQLIQLHKQHQFHQLFDTNKQLELLDEYGQYTPLLQQVAAGYQALQTVSKAIKHSAANLPSADKQALLTYQLEQLATLNLGQNEWTQLGQEHQLLSQADHFSQLCQQAMQQLSLTDTTNVVAQLSTVIKSLQPLANAEPALNPALELLNTAAIQVSEAVVDITHLQPQFTADPQRLFEIEQRLSEIDQMARQLKVAPEFLFEYQRQLQAEQQAILAHIKTLDELKAKQTQLLDDYLASAKQLSEARQQVLPTFVQEVEQYLKFLELPHAQFTAHLSQANAPTPTPAGQDSIEYLFNTNPGQRLAPVKVCASGGELSRLSLAIQVVISHKTQLPTLLFDEVDVGLSGRAAERMGQALCKLSGQAQVLCITHAPQIAALAQHHYKLSKQQSQQVTCTQVQKLGNSARVDEVARLIAGAKLTKTALAHAKHMLAVCD